MAERSIAPDCKSGVLRTSEVQILLSGFFYKATRAELAQLVEHTHGKGKVSGSIPELGFS